MMSGTRSVKVMNTLGQGGGVVTGDTTAVTTPVDAPFNRFYIVADAVFTDITSSILDGVAGLEDPVSFAAGEWLVVPGCTGYELKSGKVIAYYEV